MYVVVNCTKFNRDSVTCKSRLGLGLVMEDRLTELSCTFVHLELGKGKGVVLASDPLPAFQCCMPPPTFLGREREVGRKDRGREGGRGGEGEIQRENERTI